MPEANAQTLDSAKRELAWFLGLAFCLSWPLFLAPLALGGSDVATRQLVTTGAWAMAMLMPGVAAVVTTRWIAGRDIKSLNLGRLGPKRFYLWAWLLPMMLSWGALLLTVLVGTGRFDPTFALVRTGLAAMPADVVVPVGVFLAAQIVAGLTVGPLINTLFAMGEELGWRGYLLPKLLPKGKWRAILMSGVIWGVWHAPAIAQGHNYPGQPILGVFLMVGLCLLLGAILSWLYLETRSPWAPALAHGAVNAVAGLPLLFLEPGIDIVWGGTLASPPAWIGLALFIAWLVYTRRLPRTLTE